MKKPVFVLLMPLIVCAYFLTGCSDNVTVTVTDTATYTLTETFTTTKVLYPVEDIIWVMDAYGDSDTYSPALKNAEFTLYLDSIDGRCRGNVSLNSYWANYQLDMNQLSFPDRQYAVTELWISDVVKQQQDAYFSILMNSDKCEVIDGKLHITDRDRWIVFYKKN